MSFEYWYNEIADIPAKDENGNWVDYETGFSYQHWLKSESKPATTRTKLSDKALKARSLAKQFGGKALTGSKKQKEWAEKIRESVISKLSEESAILLCSPKSLFKTAKSWIENRDKSPKEFEVFILKQQQLLAEYNSLEVGSDATRIASEYNELTATFGF